ncbi:MAG: Sua5/YciO/YrdC/YwlC family protein [Candidatus Gracilibacteria bacterium]|nr:Sua5/YciO/YrdC/YwlC family protein [Candidatus Gracilibacteria bacterium]
MIYIIPTDTCFGIACALDDTKSYHKIYKIKNRELNKPLAIMVEDFDWLLENTTLNLEQVVFLKNYKKPFTILTNCPRIEMILNLEQEDFNYENKKFYKKIAFRVANNEIEKNLINEVGPIFLTSANFSGEKEIYDIYEAKKQFLKYTKDIKFLGENYKLDEKIKPSDIFEFDGENLEIKYLRKN